jgi:hypothetical protein
VYHCKHEAGIGDLVCPANTVSYQRNLRKQSLYLVVGLQEDYDEYIPRSDFYDMLSREKQDLTWYAFLMSPAGKIVVEKLRFLRKVNAN